MSTDSLYKLREYVVRDKNMLPRFINTKNIIHRNCNEINKLIFASMYYLMQEEILRKRGLLSLTKVVNSYLADMFELDGGISILYFEWYKDILTGYILYCIDNELWEVCANIRNFYEMLYDEKMYLDVE